MNKLSLTSKRTLLLLLYSPGISGEFCEPIEGRTRIIKMMFLFKKEIEKELLKDKNIDSIQMPEFIPWSYGPFSKEIYDDIEFLINNYYIKEDNTNKEMHDYELKEYQYWVDDFLFEDEKELLVSLPYVEIFELEKDGISFVKENIYSFLTNNQKIIIKKFKKSINGSSLEAILRYTYVNYPDYTKKSKIRDNIIDG